VTSAITSAIEKTRTRAASGQGREVVRSLGTVAVATALVIGFGLTSSPFLASENIRNIFMQTSVVGVAAIGETIIMLTGGIDLSVGAVAFLAEVIVADLSTSGHSMLVSLTLALGAAAGIGFLNGFLVAVVRIEPILATLGTLLVAAGFGKLILNLRYLQATDPIFTDLATKNVIFNLPIMVAVMFALYLVVAVAMKKTVFGRSVYAIGGNRKAARLSGLPVSRVTLAAYTVAGLIYGIAGFLTVGQLGLVSQNDLGNLNFQAIIAVLVGGLSISRGGVGSVERTLIGVLIVGMITNYQTIEGIDPAFQQALLGGLLFAAILVDRLVRGRET
jgi:ribose/xylose/arabinose/galactoside ABC-type transport system permease subunit